MTEDQCREQCLGVEGHAGPHQTIDYVPPERIRAEALAAVRAAVKNVRMPHREGDLHNYGWNDAVKACMVAIDKVADTEPPATDTE